MADGNAKAVWLDCDPGHDDAIAILLAFFAAQGDAQDKPGAQSRPAALDVLGLSTTHGNATGAHTYVNAVRLMALMAIKPDRCRVWRGSDEPLLRQGKADVGIHGEDGLGGVEGLPSLTDRLVKEHMQSADSSLTLNRDDVELPPADPLALVKHQLDMLATRRAQGLPPISLLATGPLTNVALLIKMCPGTGDARLLQETVSQIVLMGGAAATSGNRSPSAEWNILVDPEAASIVFDSPIPVVMAGLDVTHQAIFTPSLHAKLLHGSQYNPKITYDQQMIEQAHRQSSRIRRMVSSAMTFFAGTYAGVFGFVYGPPVHDMLCVAYVLDPSLFFSLQPRNNAPLAMGADDEARIVKPDRVPCSRFRVEIDTSTGLAAGTTVVDFYDQRDVEHQGWSKGGRNAIVLEYVDVSACLHICIASQPAHRSSSEPCLPSVHRLNDYGSFSLMPSMELRQAWHTLVHLDRVNISDSAVHASHLLNGDSKRARKNTYL